MDYQPAIELNWNLTKLTYNYNIPPGGVQLWELVSYTCCGGVKSEMQVSHVDHRSQLDHISVAHVFKILYWTAKQTN